MLNEITLTKTYTHWVYHNFNLHGMNNSLPICAACECYSVTKLLLSILPY